MQQLTGQSRALRVLGFEEKTYAYLCLVALLTGVLLRSMWNLLRPSLGAYGEALNVAIALSSGLGFSDAFRPGQGPTAHVLPLPPMIAAGVYRLLGAKTLSAEILLRTWSIGLSLCSYIIFNHLFRRLSVPAAARLAAVVWLCLLPIFITQEAVDFRVWDGGLAVVLAATCLLAATSNDARQCRPSAMIILPTALAFLMFVHPVLGAGTFVGIAVQAWRWPKRQQLKLACSLAILLVALFGPWAGRNYMAFNELVFLRSNGGLELAIGMNPYMVETSDAHASFERRMAQVHPYLNDRAFQFVQDKGEVAYADQMGLQTFDWIHDHPGQASKLVLRHLRSTFFPEPWIFTLVGNSTGAPLRAFIASCVGAIGLLGLGVALWQRKTAWIPVAAGILLPTLALTPFQTVPRYTYIFYAMLTFSAAYFLTQAWDFIRSTELVCRMAKPR